MMRKGNRHGWNRCGRLLVLALAMLMLTAGILAGCGSRGRGMTALFSGEMENERTLPPAAEPMTAATTEPTTAPTTEPTTVPTTVPTTEPTTVPTTEPMTAPTTLTDAESTEEDVRSGIPDYVANRNTMKFHEFSCPSVGDIKDKNRWDYYGSREDLLEMGYEPCKRCRP